MSAQRLPRIYTLPLFPLHSVLFPQLPLQLRIFEERYHVMLHRCIQRNEPFGVVLIKEGEEVGEPAEPHPVGCVARILMINRQENGELHLVAAGGERFRILEYMTADLPYLVGRVEEVRDEPLSNQNISTLMEEVKLLFRRYLNLLAEKAGMALPELELPVDPSALAFGIGSVMQLPAETKQRLLEMTDSYARLLEERRLLEEQVEELEALHARKEALREEEEMHSAEEAEPVVTPRIVLTVPMKTDSAIRRLFLEEGRN
jgi:Lon protease-like protein